MAGKPWRLRRSMMLTPGHRRERLEKAATLAADSLAFDLEDGVPPARKAEARAAVAAALRGLDFGRRERVVRINAIGTEDFARDMAPDVVDFVSGNVKKAVRMSSAKKSQARARRGAVDGNAAQTPSN